ncbi:MAG: mRNA-binding ribosome synthesis protein nop7 [Candelina submexicana]|nr:MAG: mRNA-binding ribosome synthesis protein nop7 [Candelina submexicana]
MAKIKKKGVSGSAKNFITRTQAVRKLQISLPDFRRLCIFKGTARKPPLILAEFVPGLFVCLDMKRTGKPDPHRRRIYPREPRNKKRASKSSTSSTTFYYTKDIQYLLHEPLLNKFRDHKALSKKIGRALGRGEVGDAARLERTSTPRITLDHIIKERYPTFIDALRDLDDALSMLFLFANLPSTSTVTPKTIALCQRLCLEFEHYLISTNTLRKSFLSIKGIYYQATIQGQDILWLVPYKFVQRVTGDVDFRIMGTFVEFYTTLLGFVNFRLYTSIGLIYPPKFNPGSDDQGGELGAFTLEGKGVGAPQQQEEAAPEQIETNGLTNGTIEAPQDVQAQVDSLIIPPGENENRDQQQEPREPPEEVDEAIDNFEATGPDADILPQPQFSGAEAATLFASFTFYLSRETPRQPLEFLLRAFGCKRVGWDTVLGDGAFTHNEADTTITHQVVDRPPLPPDALPEVADAEDPDSAEATPTVAKGSRVPGRIYIQPQWVWDCVNEGKLLRPDLYAPGATLPPHLSPWVKPTRGAYDPTAPLAEQEREGEAEAAADEEIEEEDEDEDEKSEMEEQEEARVGAVSKEGENDLDDDGTGMNVADSNDDDSDEDEGVAAANEEDEWGGFDEEADAESDDEKDIIQSQHQRELEAEAAGLPFSASVISQNGTHGAKRGTGASKKVMRRKKEEEEELERRRMMASRKKRKHYDRAAHSKQKVDAVAEKLRSKRRRIEKGKVLIEGIGRSTK